MPILFGRPSDRPSVRPSADCVSFVGPVSDSPTEAAADGGAENGEWDAGGRDGGDASDAANIHFREITATIHARARAPKKQVPAGAQIIEHFAIMAKKMP